MEWICDNNTITDEMIQEVMAELNVQLPEDFLTYIRKYDGGYPKLNRIKVAGCNEVVNNLVSFCKEDYSYILKIYKETEYFNTLNLIPIAEDPFGNLFCYDFNDGKGEIVFWNHERFMEKKFVCNSFAEFIDKLHK